MTTYQATPSATRASGRQLCLITYEGGAPDVRIDLLVKGDATVTISATHGTDPLRQQFRLATCWWREATRYLSSPREITSHEAYQTIINMGPDVVPFILEDLRNNGGHWYIALRKLAADPPKISQETARSTQKVVETWLEWGRQHGYRI